jgi:hypothetical protein
MARLGIRCKVYYNSATYGSPTWVEVEAVNDWKENVNSEKIKGPDRGSLVNLYGKGEMDLSWTGTIKRGGTEAAKLKTASLTDEVIDIMILDADKAVVGAIGYRVDVQVFGGSNDQGRSAILYDEVEIVPTIMNTNPPKTAVVGSGGTITFAEITGIAA